MRSISFRIRFFLVLLAVLSLTIVVSSSQEDGGKPEAFNVGFTAGTFSNVNKADALESMRVWANSMLQKKGYTFPARTTMFDNIDDLVRVVKAKKLDLVVCRSTEFVETLHTAPLDPVFICTKNGKSEDEILLLVHRQSHIEKLEELAGKNILLSNGTDVALGRLWLETLLMEKGIGSLESFFRKTSLAAKESQTVLPVFFRKADACLVARSSFETIADLNPQLRDELKILVQSPGFAPALVCIRKGYDPILREDLIDVLRNLHTEPKGQQILTLFKTDRLVPCETAHLAKIGQLINRHNQLQKASKPTEIRAEGSK